MSELTLDGAIKHCLEVEEQKERDSAELIDILDEQDVTACKECAADHRQLAEWLTELKEAKQLLKAAVEDFELIAEAKRTPKGHPHPHMREYLRVIDVLDMRWRYADEAEKLIGGSENA